MTEQNEIFDLGTRTKRLFVAALWVEEVAVSKSLRWQTTLNRTWLFSINQSQVQWRERFFYRLCNEASATNGSQLSASLISAKVPDRGMGTAISVLIHRLAWESHCCFPSLKQIRLNRNFSINAQLIRSVGDDEEFHWISILHRTTHVRARARRSETATTVLLNY